MDSLGLRSAAGTAAFLTRIFIVRTLRRRHRRLGRSAPWHGGIHIPIHCRPEYEARPPPLPHRRRHTSLSSGPVMA